MPEYRAIEGEIRLLESKNPFLFPIEVWALNDAPNRNGWQFTDMEGNKNQFAGTPLLIAYLYGGQVIGDGHNMRETIDPETGEPRMSFTAADAERIVGAISDDPADIRTEVRDGNTWIVAKGSLWAWYAAEAVQKIENDSRQGRGMSVSIEALVSESHMDGEIEVEDRYQILGTTILGDHVAPAVEGAHITMLSALGDEFKELKVRAASYQKQEQKPHNNTKKGVNKQMYLNKQQLKELRNKFGEEYAVLCAKQCADGVTKVLLMRHSDHAFCTYEVGEKDSVIDFEKLHIQSANIVVRLSEDEELCVDAAECIEAEVSENAEKVCSLTADVTRLTGELETSNNTIKAMQAQESKRRIAAAKEAAKRALSDYNANREDVIGDELLNAINTDIEAGVYANSVNADGDWVGETAVADRVFALCAHEQMKLDKANAQRKRETHILDKFNTAAADDGGVQGLLARKGIN